MWRIYCFSDWKTAVFILPSTESHGDIGLHEIGRLPYLYFLLLERLDGHLIRDWKTAVFILPSTEKRKALESLRLEDCRIYTSFYYRKLKTASYQHFQTILRHQKALASPVVLSCFAVFCRCTSVNQTIDCPSSRILGHSREAVDQL